MKIGDRVRWRNPAIDKTMGEGEILDICGGMLKIRFEDYEYSSPTDHHRTLTEDVRCVRMSSYESIGAEIGALVTTKQQAYGDSFGKSGDVLRILYPDGIKPEQYSDALCLTRILDKIFRIATDKDALGEDPYRDIAGYALLAVERRQQK